MTKEDEQQLLDLTYLSDLTFMTILPCMICIISSPQFLGLVGMEGYKFLKLCLGALGEERMLGTRRQLFLFFFLFLIKVHEKRFSAYSGSPVRRVYWDKVNWIANKTNTLYKQACTA